MQQHRFTYNEPMPVESCTQSLCDLALQFGEDADDSGGGGGGMVRFFVMKSSAGQSGVDMHLLPDVQVATY